jgi:hypothetical protein
MQPLVYQLTPSPRSTLFQSHENNHDSDETLVGDGFKMEQGGEVGSAKWAAPVHHGVCQHG